MGRKTATTMCLVALIGLVGCNDDNNVFTPPQINSSDPASAAGAIGAAVILPAIETLDRFNLDTVLSAIPTRGGTPQECIDYSDVCSAGALELCFDGLGQSYEFTECMTNLAGMFDGMISESESTVSYDLEVDGTAFVGTVDVAWAEGCVIETINTLSVATSSGSSTVSGTLTYCDGDERPSGAATFTTAGSFGAWRIDLTLDGGDVAQAQVTDLTTLESDTCMLDLRNGETTCGDG